MKPLAFAVLTTLAGVVIGITGYVSFLQSGAADGLSGLAIFWFALVTPVGLLATYLAMSGMMRVATVVAGDPWGDPILMGIAALARYRREAEARRKALALRASLEGGEVRDRVVPGVAVGFDEADLVVVASRQKPEWTTGTFVDTGGVWYRIGDPVQRDTPNGLRSLYPLHEVRDLGVIRRKVTYDLANAVHPSRERVRD